MNYLFKSLFLLLFIFLQVSGCRTTQSEKADDAKRADYLQKYLYNRKWIFERLGLPSSHGDVAFALAAPRGQEYTLFFENDSIFNGLAHCTPYSGTYRISGDTIFIINLTTSKSTCDDHSITKEFLETLQSVYFLKQYESGIILFSREKGSLAFRTNDLRPVFKQVTIFPIVTGNPFSRVKFPENPYNVATAPVITGDTLKISIGFNGGCKYQDFEIYAARDAFRGPGDVYSADLKLVHNNNKQDTCTMHLVQELLFDLKPLRDIFIKDTRKEHGEIYLLLHFVGVEELYVARELIYSF
ncbi:MAG: META domain-containing protein [Bacteroidota bacterium]